MRSSRWSRLFPDVPFRLIFSLAVTPEPLACRRVREQAMRRTGMDHPSLRTPWTSPPTGRWEVDGIDTTKETTYACETLDRSGKA
jgi:hypothetical protein